MAGAATQSAYNVGRALVVRGEEWPDQRRTEEQQPGGPVAHTAADAVELGGNVRFADAWRKVLGIDDPDLALLLDRLGPLMRLPHEVRQAVLDLGDKVTPDLLLQ